jgi:hypothetical protein
VTAQCTGPSDSGCESREWPTAARHPRGGRSWRSLVAVADPLATATRGTLRTVFLRRRRLEHGARCRRRHLPCAWEPFIRGNERVFSSPLGCALPLECRARALRIDIVHEVCGSYMADDCRQQSCEHVHVRRACLVCALEMSARTRDRTASGGGSNTRGQGPAVVCVDTRLCVARRLANPDPCRGPAASCGLCTLKCSKQCVTRNVMNSVNSTVPHNKPTSNMHAHTERVASWGEN